MTLFARVHAWYFEAGICSLSDAIILDVLSRRPCHGYDRLNEAAGGWSRRWFFLSSRETIEGYPGWQARMDVRVGNKWSCRHRSLSASSRGYIYTELKLVMYPKKSSRGGLVLTRPQAIVSAMPGHRVSSDYSWFWSPHLGSGYYDTRVSPARVSRMSLARHRHLTSATMGPNTADIESR